MSSGVRIPAVAMSVIPFGILPRLDVSEMVLTIAGSLSAFVSHHVLILVFAACVSLLDARQEDDN